MKNLIRNILREDDLDWMKDVSEIDSLKDSKHIIIFNKVVNKEEWDDIFDLYDIVPWSLDEYRKNMVNLKKPMVLWYDPQSRLPLSWSDYGSVRQYKDGHLEINVTDVLDIVNDEKPNLTESTEDDFDWVGDPTPFDVVEFLLDREGFDIKQRIGAGNNDGTKVYDIYKDGFLVIDISWGPNSNWEHSIDWVIKTLTTDLEPRGRYYEMQYKSRRNNPHFPKIIEGIKNIIKALDSYYWEGNEFVNESTEDDFDWMRDVTIDVIDMMNKLLEGSLYSVREGHPSRSLNGGKYLSLYWDMREEDGNEFDEYRMLTMDYSEYEGNPDFRPFIRDLSKQFTKWGWPKKRKEVISLIRDGLKRIKYKP